MSSASWCSISNSNSSGYGPSGYAGVSNQYRTGSYGGMLVWVMTGTLLAGCRCIKYIRWYTNVGASETVGAAMAAPSTKMAVVLPTDSKWSLVSFRGTTVEGEQGHTVISSSASLFMQDSSQARASIWWQPAKAFKADHKHSTGFVCCTWNPVRGMLACLIANAAAKHRQHITYLSSCLCARPFLQAC